jgi:hypothetical protein
MLKGFVIPCIALTIRNWVSYFFSLVFCLRVLCGLNPRPQAIGDTDYRSSSANLDRSTVSILLISVMTSKTGFATASLTYRSRMDNITYVSVSIREPFAIARKMRIIALRCPGFPFGDIRRHRDCTSCDLRYEPIGFIRWKLRAELIDGDSQVHRLLPHQEFTVRFDS